MLARTTQDTTHGPAYIATTLPAGTTVEIEPATNMPEDNPIKYWVSRVVDESDIADKPLANLRAFAGTSGIGLYADDVELLPPPELETLIDTIRYNVTHETVSAEGEEVDSGFDKRDEPLDLYVDDLLDALDEGIDPDAWLACRIRNLLDDLGATERCNDTTWRTPDADIDQRTGEHTTRTVHLTGVPAEVLAMLD